MEKSKDIGGNSCQHQRKSARLDFKGKYTSGKFNGANTSKELTQGKKLQTC